MSWLECSSHLFQMFQHDLLAEQSWLLLRPHKVSVCVGVLLREKWCFAAIVMSWAKQCVLHRWPWRFSEVVHWFRNYSAAYLAQMHWTFASRFSFLLSVANRICPRQGFAGDSWPRLTGAKSKQWGESAFHTAWQHLVAWCRMQCVALPLLSLRVELGCSRMSLLWDVFDKDSILAPSACLVLSQPSLHVWSCMCIVACVQGTRFLETGLWGQPRWYREIVVLAEPNFSL